MIEVGFTPPVQVEALHKLVASNSLYVSLMSELALIVRHDEVKVKASDVNKLKDKLSAEIKTMQSLVNTLNEGLGKARTEVTLITNKKKT